MKKRVVEELKRNEINLLLFVKMLGEGEVSGEMSFEVTLKNEKPY